MTFETFFDKFDQFTDAPNAVAKLRELVLKLAFTGKLLRKNSTGSELPEGWAVQSIEAIAQLITPGFACSRNHQVENGHVHLRTHNISTLGTLNFDLLVRVAPQMVDLQRSSIKAGDILFNNTNSQELVGKTCLVDCDYEFGFSNHITRIRLKEGFHPNFVVFYLTLLRNSGYFSRICTRWINQAAVNTDTLKLQKIPLPPLAEQKQIVAKIDELMALCDRLEAQLQARETQQAALARAALARFADAPTPANLELLFHPAFAVAPADLRKSILTLAVQGKLVEQDSSDGSALQLLSAIEDNINILRQKKEFRGSPIEPLERKNMLRIPINWEWVRLGNIVDYGSSDKYDSSDIPADAWLLDLEDIEKDTSRLLRRKLFQDSPSKSTKTAFRAGDVLYGKLRPYLNKVIVADQPGYCTTEIVPIRAFGYIDSAYLCYALKCPNFIDYANTKSYGMNLPRLGTEDARRAPFPLPPLAEQRRIVAKVDELMTLVNVLELHLRKSREIHNKLLEAAINEITGNKSMLNEHLPSNNTNSTEVKQENPMQVLDQLSLLQLSTSNFCLHRFAMKSNYRSLREFECDFHPVQEDSTGASPICLVGLNGSGKSNLIEAIAEVFCFLELINLPWEKVKSPASRYRENSLRFELEYMLENAEGRHMVQIQKTKNRGVDFFIVKDDESKHRVAPGLDQLKLLPRRIIGYSSGLNETISHPFLRTKTIYSEEVRDAALPQLDDSAPNALVSDTRTLYMDYESNAAIILSNYIFKTNEELGFIDQYTRVHSVSSFGLRFNRKRAGRSGKHKMVLLTHELESYLKSFHVCAGEIYNEEQEAFSLNFNLTPEVVALFKQEFKTAERLFMAMYKWSLLNALILSDEQRKVYLSNDITKGALERPPSVPPSERIFNILDLKLRLSNPKIEIDYSGLSDGEHQFIQVFGTVLLFSEPGTLFLFDEPESHFNPEWRTKFNLILNRLPNSENQEFIISTHSPFLVSGVRDSNVYKFTRTEEGVTFKWVDFETYGAQFDFLLRKLFSIDSLIDQSARQELQQIIRRGDIDEMNKAASDFAESREKRRLYEAILQKEEDSK